MTTIFDFLDNVKMDHRTSSTKRKFIIDDKDEKEEEDISDEVYIYDQSIPHCSSIPLGKKNQHFKYKKHTGNEKAYELG